jgi:nucleoside-diphosphate-sugar epimerase
MSMHNVLVTGATGFVGTALVPALQRVGMTVCATSRSTARPLPAQTDRIVWLPGAGHEALRAKLGGVTDVVHLAGRVHVMVETESDPISAYRAANVDAALEVAEAAVANGVRRFIYASTVKVFGESGHFSEGDIEAPVEPYGRSKLEAENVLRAFGTSRGLDVVIVRPPLVYGPGVKANFASLLRLVARGWPMPFRLVDNRRSYLGVDNLVDSIRAILEHPTPINETFTITDGADISTATLIRQMASAMGRRALLFPVPTSVLVAASATIGRRMMMERLVGSLSFESTRVRSQLGWSPPVALSEGLRRIVANLSST